MTTTNCGTIRCWRASLRRSAQTARRRRAHVDPESAGAKPRRRDETSQGEPPSGSDRDAAPHSIGCVCMGEKQLPALSEHGRATFLLIADLWEQIEWP